MELYTAGHALETIVKRLKRAGHIRTPSGIQAHMSRLRERRHGNFLALQQFAHALGLDSKVVTRWVHQGLLTPAYATGIGSYLSYAEMRRFVVAHPLRIAHGAIDIVWLVGLLVPPRGGDTRDVGHQRHTDASGAWIQGSAIADRAAAD